MECGTCTKTYNSSEVIPLSCKCGKTQCQMCIRSQLINDSYFCTACKKSTVFKDLIKNRGIEDVIFTIQGLRQSKSNLPQAKKIFIENKETSKYLNGDNKQSDSNTIICVHQATETVIQCSSHKTQTALSYVPNEKIRSKKLKIRIAWKKCFILPVYFLFQSPWIFLAVFGYNKGQEEKM